MASANFRTWRNVAIVLALLLGVFVAWRAAGGYAPSRNEFAVQGIVVDSQVGPINWPTLAAKGSIRPRTIWMPSRAERVTTRPRAA